MSFRVGDCVGHPSGAPCRSSFDLPELRAGAKRFLPNRVDRISRVATKHCLLAWRQLKLLKVLGTRTRDFFSVFLKVWRVFVLKDGLYVTKLVI